MVTAKDERGNPLPYEYEQYFAAENGQDLVLTLDANVQYYLEKYVGEMADKYGAEHGATGIVMDVKTGGILGMVSYPTYDVNDAFTVQNDLFKKNLTDTSDQLLKQWRNKALNDTYEPGSTFKILTMSAAMEEGLINMNTTYTCTGGIHVSDATIHCTGTHGTQTLKEAAAHSCNPAFITFGLQLGNEKFYEYMNDFGLMNGTGVDLDGEATGVFASPENFTQLDLACYAFGQNFNVTPLALIAAQPPASTAAICTPPIWWSRSWTATATSPISTTTPPCARWSARKPAPTSGNAWNTWCPTAPAATAR